MLESGRTTKRLLPLITCERQEQTDTVVLESNASMGECIAQAGSAGFWRGARQPGGWKNYPGL